MLRKGFTLIELLIVITIIAILAGAALPYVSDYVEDARISKAKRDLFEIKNALVRWEVDNARFWPTADTTISNLAGNYLEKNLIDPWGNAYVIDPPSSLVYCWGPDGVDGSGTGDDFSIDFRPPLAISKAYWIDMDKDTYVSTGDNISLRFTRPCGNIGANTNYTITSPARTVGAGQLVLAADRKSATLTLADATTAAFTSQFNITAVTPVVDTATKFGGPFAIRNNVAYIKPL